VVDADDLKQARRFLREGSEVNQMMKVVGEEGTSIEDFIVYLKGEYIDSVYLQQNAFSEVDAATPAERQRYVFSALAKILRTKLKFENKDAARAFFHKLTQATRDWNNTAFESEEFKKQQEQISALLVEVTDYA
jgi:V/A-type H+-transporting ATPase subunit A